MNLKGRPPVIVIGMHRSGTGIFTRTLEDLGLFVGEEKEKNHEALFFLDTNEWLLKMCGGAFDHPEPIQYLLDHKEMRPLIAGYLRERLQSPRIVSFLGKNNYETGRTPFNLEIPWGWKDPRNTYTLPLWLDLFPNAKVIHVFRNGVDVAASLERRGKEELTWARIWSVRNMKHELTHDPDFPRLVSSMSCLGLKNGFKLWESYMNKAGEMLQLIPDENKMEIRYEDLMADDGSIFAAACRFAGIETDDVCIKAVLTTLKGERAHAYEKNRPLLLFYDSVKNSPTMIQYGYGAGATVEALYAYRGAADKSDTLP